MSDEKIIAEITAIRAANNKLWMQLLTIAMKHAPHEAKDVLRDITTNDLLVSGLTRKLAQ